MPSNFLIFQSPTSVQCCQISIATALNINCMHLLGYLLWRHNLYKPLCFIFLCRNSPLAKSTSFRFLSVCGKEKLGQVKIRTALPSTSLSESFHAYPWGTRKEKFPVLRTCGKSHQLVSDELLISKSMNCLGSITFAQNWNIGISVHRLQILESLFNYAWKKSSFSRLHLIIETKDARP